MKLSYTIIILKVFTVNFEISVNYLSDEMKIKMIYVSTLKRIIVSLNFNLNKIN